MQHMAVSILSVALIALAYAQGRPATVEALDGVDPVLLVQGKEVSGKSELKIVRGGFEYLVRLRGHQGHFREGPGEVRDPVERSLRPHGQGHGRTSCRTSWSTKGGPTSSDPTSAARSSPRRPSKSLPAAPVRCRRRAARPPTGARSSNGRSRRSAARRRVDQSRRMSKRPRRFRSARPETCRSRSGRCGDFPAVRMERTATVQGKTDVERDADDPCRHVVPGAGPRVSADRGRPAQHGVRFRPPARAAPSRRREAGFKAAALGPASRGRRGGRSRARRARRSRRDARAR